MKATVTLDGKTMTVETPGTRVSVRSLLALLGIGLQPGQSVRLVLGGERSILATLDSSVYDDDGVEIVGESAPTAPALTPLCTDDELAQLRAAAESYPAWAKQIEAWNALCDRLEGRVRERSDDEDDDLAYDLIERLHDATSAAVVSDLEAMGDTMNELVHLFQPRTP